MDVLELCLSRWGIDPVTIFQTWTEPLFVGMVGAMKRNLRREAGREAGMRTGTYGHGPSRMATADELSRLGVVKGNGQ